MILCILDHPTQYDPPLWRAMTRAGRQRPLVWYVTPRPPSDPEIDRNIDWSTGAEDDANHHVPLSSLARALFALKPRPTAILVSGWTRPATWQVLPVARLLGIPVILSTDKTLNEVSRGGVLGTANSMFHATKARLFDGFFTTGLLGSQYLASIGCSHETIARGLYPVDVAHWQERKRALAAEASAIRATTNSRFVVLAVCKLSERESPLLLLDAFAKLKRSRPGVFLIQVGDGPLRAAFEKRVLELGLAHDVRLAGYVEYNQLAAYYGAADVFTHTPVSEPWGISVLEAMACERPVVSSTTVGSAADLVVHGRTGALSYPGDAVSIATALAMVAERNSSNEMGRRAFETVDCLDVDFVAGGLVDLVERLASRTAVRRESIVSVLRADVRNEFGRWSR